MYRRILVVLDHAAHSRAATEAGIAIAQAHNADIVFVHCLPVYVAPPDEMAPGPVLSPREFQRMARKEAEALLAEAIAAAEQAGVMAIAVTRPGDEPARCVAAAAKSRRCDLIVAGTDGGNALLRLLAGSIVPGLISAAPVPVLIVKPPPHGDAESALQPIRRVMVVVGEEDPAQSAAHEAAALAATHGAQLLVVDVGHQASGHLLERLSAMVSAPGEPPARAHDTEQLQAQAMAIAHASGVNAQGLTVTTDRDLETAVQSLACDIVVVPNTSQGALMRLLSGNIIPRLVTDVTVPVLVCRREAAAVR